MYMYMCTYLIYAIRSILWYTLSKNCQFDDAIDSQAMLELRIIWILKLTTSDRWYTTT